jgi:hypothetical protein
VVTDEHDMMALEFALPDVDGASAIRIGQEAVALLRAHQGGTVGLSSAADLVRSGMAPVLIGQRECLWLDAKRQPYGLDQDRHRFELAKDVAAFANGVGGLILIGASTETIRSGERLAEINPIPLRLVDVQRMRDVLDRWVFPVVEDLEIDVIQVGDNRGLAYIYVPPQPEERRPFLVVGAEVGGKVVSVFVSVPTRRDDDTHYRDVAALHGLLLAGRLALAQLNTFPPGEPTTTS